MPPYPLLDNSTMSTHQVNSSKGGGFNDTASDKKGDEHIYTHAERNFTFDQEGYSVW